MTKYIGKKIIVSIMILLAAGFVLYMLTITRQPDPEGFITLGYDVAILRKDTLYYYDRDYDTFCFTPFYFIPVKTVTVFEEGGIMLSYDENGVFTNFEEKYYISPFTNEHIIARYGLSSRVYTLYKTEKAVTQ